MAKDSSSRIKLWHLLHTSFNGYTTMINLLKKQILSSTLVLMVMPKWLTVLNFGHVTIPGMSPWLGGCRFVGQEGVHHIIVRQRLKQKPVICFNHKILQTRDSDSNQSVPWRVAFVAVLKPTVLYTLNHLHLTGSTVIRGSEHCKTWWRRTFSSCIRNVYSCNSAVTVRRDLACFCI